MKLKQGVTLEGAKPELLRALEIADSVYIDLASREVVVTSIKDGKHGVNSLHYSGYAADLRIRDLTPTQEANIYSELKHILGNDYDVVLEIDHIHLEYDPD